MRTHIFRIAVAILFSLLINAPFAIGEFLTRDVSGPRAGFPFTLFIGLWVEMALFAYLLGGVVDSFRKGRASIHNILLAVQTLILGVLAWAWVTLIIDQWPCFFLGGSGC